MFEGRRDCPPSGEKERLPRVGREAYGRPTKAVDRWRRLILSEIDVNAREIYCFTGLAHSSMPLASLFFPPFPRSFNPRTCSFSLFVSLLPVGVVAIHRIVRQKNKSWLISQSRFESYHADDTTMYNALSGYTIRRVLVPIHIVHLRFFLPLFLLPIIENQRKLSGLLWLYIYNFSLVLPSHCITVFRFHRFVQFINISRIWNIKQVPSNSRNFSIVTVLQLRKSNSL